MILKRNFIFRFLDLVKPTSANFSENAQLFNPKKPLFHPHQPDGSFVHNLLNKLKEKKLNSDAFIKAVKAKFEAIKISFNKNSVIDTKKIEYEIQQIYSILAESPRYLKSSSAIEVLSLFHEYGQLHSLNKATLDNLIESLTLQLGRKDISESELEIIYNSVYELLEKTRQSLSPRLFTVLLKTSNYHEIFDQNDIENIESVFADYKRTIHLYDETLVSHKTLTKFLKIAFSKYPSFKLFDIAFSYKITLNELRDFAGRYLSEQYSPENTDMPIIPIEYLIKYSSISTSPELWMSFHSQIEIDPNIPLSAKLEFLLKLGEADKINTKPVHYKNKKAKKEAAKAKKASDDLKIQKIKNIIADHDLTKLTEHEFSSILKLLPKVRRLSPKLNSFVVQKLTDALLLNLNIIEKLDYIDLVTTALFFRLYSSSSSINLILLTITRKIATLINNFDELLVTLTVLLNFRILPREAIKLLPKFDSKERRKLSNIDTIYYIMAYCNLFSSTQEFNTISHNGLQNIEDILENNHKNLSLGEKCIILMRMKNISSQNKNLYIAKELLQNYDIIPDKYFASTVNNLCNYNYFQIDHQKLLAEVTRRMDVFDHKDLVYIGKGLIWHDLGDDKFWVNYFKRLNNLIKPTHFDNIGWTCDLYQIIYSIKTRNEALYSLIEGQSEDMDFEEIKNIYFERPHMPTSEEITKSEYEVEEILNNLNVNYERQQMKGIHKVDFIVDDKLVIEIYGRHHYAEKILLNGATLWREKQLSRLGYKVKGIHLQDWNSLGTEEKKIAYIKKILS